MNDSEIDYKSSVAPDIKYNILPEHIRAAMWRYIEFGVLPGHFLRAVIQDKLVESFGKADEVNEARMFDIANFMYNEAPHPCRGSKEKMIEWNKLGGLRGLRDQDKAAKEKKPNGI